MAKTAFSPDFLDDVLEGRVLAGPAHGEVAALARLARGCGALAVAGPDPATAGRMLARFRESMRDDRNQPVSTWLAGWAGLGSHPRPLVQRLAAAGVLVVAASSGASVASGESPLSVASGTWDLARRVVVNLNPARTSDAPPVDSGSPGGGTPGATITPTEPPVNGTQAASATVPGSPTGDAGSAATATGPAGAGATLNTDATTTTTSSATPTPPAATPGGPAANPTAAPASATPASASPAATATPATTPVPTIAPSTTTPVSTTPASTPTATPSSTPTTAPSPSHDYAAGEAGTVSLAISGSTLSLVGIATNPGWSVVESNATATSVHIKFAKGELAIEFEAELDAGAIKTQVSASEEDA